MLPKPPVVQAFSQPASPVDKVVPDRPKVDVVVAIQVDKVDTGLYTSRGLWKPYGNRGVFGGQVIAQSIRAAANTVDPTFYVHSLHCYFIRAGTDEIPILYQVDNLRSGRTYATRVVKATQRGRAVFTASISFAQDEPGPVLYHQPEMPDVPPPEAMPTYAQMIEEKLNNPELSLSAEERKKLLLSVEETATLDRHSEDKPGKRTYQYTWMKTRDRLYDDDRTLHACIAAYGSDFGFISSTPKAHGLTGSDLGLMVSLDHQMWFHAPFRADEWLLYEISSKIANNGRALCMGQLYTRDGRLVATTVQEGALRLKRQTKI